MLCRKTIVMGAISSPFSIALYEDWLYWADWGSDSLMACNRHTGRDKSVVHHGDVKATVLKIVHQVHQPSGGLICHRYCLVLKKSLLISCSSCPRYKSLRQESVRTRLSLDSSLVHVRLCPWVQVNGRLALLFRSGYVTVLVPFRHVGSSFTSYALQIMRLPTASNPRTSSSNHVTQSA